MTTYRQRRRSDHPIPKIAKAIDDLTDHQRRALAVLAAGPAAVASKTDHQIPRTISRTMAGVLFRAGHAKPTGDLDHFKRTIYTITDQGRAVYDGAEAVIRSAERRRHSSTLRSLRPHDDGKKSS